MKTKWLEIQSDLEEVGTANMITPPTSWPNGNGGLRRTCPELHPRPENDEGKPEPWRCQVCGHVREPEWVTWKGEWYLHDGDCERCSAAVLGEAALALARQRTIAKYGLDTGEYAHMTFDTYSPRHPTQIEAQAAARRLVDTWRSGNWRTGMLLVSPDVGVGKTHLAIAAAREGLFLYTPQKFERILTIWDVPTLLGDIKNSYNNGGPAHIMEAAKTSGILVMDDLGAEDYRRESWYQNILYDIFNSRWLHHKTTIVTTNLAPDELQARVSSRVWSRMLSLTKHPVLLSGRDFRLAALKRE
jgi:DNA replication protein DnaC